MRGCGWGWFLGVFGICGSALGQPVPPPPATQAESVATEQHPIQVGDVIMAPATPSEAEAEAEVDDEPGSIRRPGAKRASGTKHRWYGLPILLSDGVAYGLIAAAIAEEKTTSITAPLGLPVYALGGPIVHAANGRWGRAGISLLLRTSLPLAGVAVGASGCGRGHGDCTNGILALAVTGMSVAALIDISALAWKPIESPKPLSLRVQPSLSLGKDLAWLGASGTF
jgi:hypothetical protein